MGRKLRSILLAALLGATGVSSAHAGDFGIRIGKGSQGLHVQYKSGKHKTTGIRVVRGAGNYSCCEFQPGRYVTRQVRSWLPARCERVWVPARYETAWDSCGNPHQVLVEAGHFEDRHIAGRYETQTRREWVPGRRVCRHGRHRW